MSGRTRRFPNPMKYLAVGRITLRSHLAYIPELLWRTIFMALVIFVFTQLWRTTYTVLKVPVIAGLNLRQMIWYLVVSETIVLSRPRQVSLIDQEVKSGDLAYRLNKPYSYIGYHYAAYMAEAFIRLIINFSVGAVVALTLVGPFPVNPLAVPLLFLAAALGLSIEFLVNFCIGLGAFWLEDTASFALVYDKLLFILGGMMIPLDLFPDVIREISLRLPMNFIIYRPARMLVLFDHSSLMSLFGGQALWIIVLTLAAAAIYRAGVKRVNVNGG